MSTISRLARSMWHQLEPVHAAVYFAWRTAPLGTAGPHLVSAAYYSFSPAMIAEHVPAIWATASPAEVLTARLEAVDHLYRDWLGDQLTSPALAEAAELARSAAESITTPGRPLAAANLDQPWPAEPHLALWQAATILREHRGDGHLAALQAAGLDGCESLVSFAAIGAAPVETFAGRGWNSEEWAAAAERLRERGLIDSDGLATEAGRALRDQVERMTDELAAAPWRGLGEERAQRLAQLNGPVLGAVFEAGVLPMTSTLGIATVKAPD